MTQFAFDRIAAGLTDAIKVAQEIKDKAAKRPLYTKIPAHVLVEEFLVPNRLDLKDVSRIGHIHPTVLHKFVRGEARIDDTLASKLSFVFKTSKEYWLDLQAEFDEKGSL